MRFFNSQHQVYCGVDLHAKTLHVCVVDSLGEERLHKNSQCHDGHAFPEAFQPIRDNRVVGC
ncbi:MAG: hypothetical protein JNL67_22700 [Planctomycetaceae bacterium]|nr:hypothetical protein [Planctomycetaceae bacterium]